MQGFLSIWGALDQRRKIAAVFAVFATLASFFAISQVGGTNNQVLLYSNLESAAAGEVIAKLEQSGVSYEVRGRAIYVDPAVRDSLRMTLASEGLPSVSGAGYELLDSLSGFGTTSQMFDAAYWRAKEGELARTIVTDTQIKSARVHISNSPSSPFSAEFAMKASVTITVGAAPISTSKVTALKFLIASAVAGLDVANVSVIDTQRGLISANEAPFSTASANSDLAAGLRKSVERLLEARVGYGNAVVEVSVETNTDSETISERNFNPDTRVIISTDTEERSTQSDDSRGVGGVSVASNLPSGDASSDRKSSSQNTETRERVNYEVSETKREILKKPGAIKRLTVAVLVNGTVNTQDDGSSLYADRSEKELAELHDLVAAAVGYREDRGDIITVKTMEFGQPSDLGTEASSSTARPFPLNLMALIQLAVLALVAIILGVFVVRPVILGRSKAAYAELPAPFEDNQNLSTVTEFERSENAPSLLPLSGEIDVGEFNPADLEEQGAFLQENITPQQESPVDRLKELIEDRQNEAVDVLRRWMEEKEESI